MSLRVLLLVWCYSGGLVAQMPSDINSAIANGIRPAQVESPIDAAIRAQRLRALELENQQRQLQIQQQAEHIQQQREGAEYERARQQAQAQLRATPPPPKPEPKLPSPSGNEMKTAGAFNGRAWLAMTNPEKTLYLAGGAEVPGLGTADRLHEFCSGALTFDETAEALNLFFHEPENRLIRIIDSMQIIVLKAKGSPQAEIDEEISLARRFALSAPERAGQ